MPIQAANPFGSFIQGRAARQDEQSADTRNALGQQALETGNLRNKLAQDQYSQAQVQQALQQTAATASRLAQSQNVREELQMYPEFAQGLAKQHPEITQMQDDELRQYLGFVAGQAQSKLGVGPAPTASSDAYTLKPGEARYKGDQKIAERDPVEKPDSGFNLSPGQTRYDANNKPVVTAPQASGGNPDNVDTAAQAIANYQQSPLGSMAMRSAYGQAVMARVMEINPDYQANEFGSRAKGYKEFTTGKNGNAVRSFNVAISHLHSLQDVADAMGNGDIPSLNKVKQAWQRETGKAAPNTFDGMKKIVTDEIVKAIVGAGGGVADREEASKTISAANSPEQLRGIMEGYKDLMAGQLGGLQQQYEQSTGRKDFTRFLSKQSIQYLDSHIGGQQQEQPAQQQQAAPRRVKVDAQGNVIGN